MTLHLHHIDPHGFYFTNGGVKDSTRYYQQGNLNFQVSKPTYYETKEAAIAAATTEGHTIHDGLDAVHHQSGK